MIQQQRGPEADGILPGIKSPAEGQHTPDQSLGKCPLLRFHRRDFILAGKRELLAAPFDHFPFTLHAAALRRWPIRV